MKKIFFSSLVIIFFLIIVYISINSNFRRTILNLSSGLLNNYYSILIRQNLGSEEGISKAITILENQIKITDIITTNQKNRFIDNIYFNTYRIEEHIKSEKNLLSLSRAIKILIKKDPKIYNAIIWKAKIMSIERKNEEQIYNQIKSAIELSPANVEAYRFALDYYQEKDNIQKFDKFCKDYHVAFLGSYSIKNTLSRFEETSLTRFAIQINGEKKNETYIVNGVNLKDSQDYVINLEQASNFSEFTFLSNFFPGTLISILDIELKDVNDKIIKVPLNEVFISTKKSFFIFDNNIKKIIVTNLSDEKISIKLRKIFKNINELKIRINFSKANITSAPKC